MPPRALILLLSLVLLGCGAVSHSPESLFTDVSQSPDTGCHQGYATDGTSHFLFDTHRILKRADDATWHITGVNDTPFEGLTGFDHIGDGDYFEGKLYAPVEHYTSCTNDSNPAVVCSTQRRLYERASSNCQSPKRSRAWPCGRRRGSCGCRPIATADSCGYTMWTHSY